MPNEITPEQRAEWRKLDEAASKPWKAICLDEITGPYFTISRTGKQEPASGWHIETPIQIGNHECSAMCEADAKCGEVARNNFRALLDEVERLQTQYNTLTKLYGRSTQREEVLQGEVTWLKKFEELYELHAPPTPEEWHKVCDQCNAFADENRRLREALEFYADADNWGLLKERDAQFDRGERARAALAAFSAAEPSPASDGAEGKDSK